MKLSSSGSKNFLPREAPLLHEEEELSPEVYEEHQKLLREFEEYRECILCSQGSKKLRRGYALFKDTTSMEIPEFEAESLTFRADFKTLMEDRILNITID